MPAQFRPKPKFTASLFSSPPTVSGGPLWGTSRVGSRGSGCTGSAMTRLSSNGLQQGSRDGPKARGAAGIGGVQPPGRSATGEDGVEPGQQGALRVRERFLG